MGTWKTCLMLATLCGAALPLVWADELVDGPVLGIDLGTTFSYVAVHSGGQVNLVTRDDGRRDTPSYVSFADDDSAPLVGESAKDMLHLRPEKTVYDIKRILGLPFSDHRVEKLQNMVPFSIVEDKGKAAIKIVHGSKDSTKKEQVIATEKLSMMVLRSLKEAAEAYLDKQVKYAVIAVPAHYNEGQRQATKDAAVMAGLTPLRLIGEPSAAALAYGLQQGADRVVLVYDLGGGTLDVSVLKIEGGEFRVLATGGDPFLGGEDFNQRVVEYLVKVVQKKHDKDLRSDASAMRSLRTEVEKSKCRLSAVPQAKIVLDAFDGALQISETLTRSRFEDLNIELFEHSIKVVGEVLKDAGLRKAEIDDVVLVGGSSRIPKIQQLLQAFFDGKELARGINPLEAVAYGAAMQGHELSKSKDEQEMVLVDVTPLTLGVELAGGIMAPVISRNTMIPCENSTVLSTHRDNQPGLRLKVFEGERLLSKNNHLLGSFTIRDIPPAPRGQPQIQLTFTIDASGLLSVKAEDRATGVAADLAITWEQGRPTAEDVELMVKDAEEFAEADLEAKDRIEARMELQEYISTTEASESSGQEAMAAALMDARDWLASNPDPQAEETREKLQELMGVADSTSTESTEREGSEAEGSGSFDEL